MTPEKIITVVEMYERRLQKEGMRKIRMDPKRTFASASNFALLEHAHFLCDLVKQYALDPEKIGKANRHLSSIQILLSFAGWYTLEDLMSHNRPD